MKDTPWDRCKHSNRKPKSFGFDFNVNDRNGDRNVGSDALNPKDANTGRPFDRNFYYSDDDDVGDTRSCSYSYSYSYSYSTTSSSDSDDDGDCDGSRHNIDNAIACDNFSKRTTGADRFDRNVANAVRELEYFERLSFPRFPDSDDDTVLNVGSNTFGKSLKNDEWTTFGKDFYAFVIRITEISEIWYENLKEFETRWDEIAEKGCDCKSVAHNTKDSCAVKFDEAHSWGLSCMELDPMDANNGVHLCQMYLAKISHAAVVLYDRLIQYYLAGSTIRMFTRLLKLKEFNKLDTNEYVPEMTITLCTSLFVSLQKLRLVCRFSKIRPKSALDYYLRCYEMHECLRKSAAYGMRPIYCSLKRHSLYEMKFVEFSEMLANFVQHWNTCYVDENYNSYLNLMLDRVCLFYATDVTGRDVLNDESYVQTVSLSAPNASAEKNENEYEDEDEDGNDRENDNGKPLEKPKSKPKLKSKSTSTTNVSYPNFNASLKMDMQQREFLSKMHQNKKYGRMKVRDFLREGASGHEESNVREKREYFENLRKFMKVWLFYKLQTDNALLDEDVGDRYQEAFITTFESEWYIYHKREILSDLSYHPSRTPKILLKQIKPEASVGIVNESANGLKKLFKTNRTDPKMRGYADWLRLYLLLNMFVENCANIASKNSPYVLHVNQTTGNYDWFCKKDFPFLYFSGGRYHVFYDGYVVYTHDVPYDFSIEVKRRCDRLKLNYRDLSAELRRTLLDQVNKSQSVENESQDVHWYLPKDCRDMVYSVNTENIYTIFKDYDDVDDDDENSFNVRMDSHVSIGSDDEEDDDGDRNENDTIDVDVDVAEEALKSLNLKTREIHKNLFSRSLADGDTVYDTLCVWICIVVSRGKSSELFKTIKSGLIKSCEILIERINHVSRTHPLLKAEKNFIESFMSVTKQLDLIF